MIEGVYTVKFAYTKSIVRDIIMLYIRKRLLGKVARLVVVFLFFVFAFVRQILSPEAGDTRWLSLGYAGIAVSIAFIGCLKYKSLEKTIEKGYRVDINDLIEYQFTNNKMVTSREGKQTELFWEDVKEVWVSANVLVLVDLRKKLIALPILMLDKQQKIFVMNKLIGLCLLSKRQMEYLLAKEIKLNSPRQP